MAKVTSTRINRARVRRLPLPPSRDAFVNARFLRLTPDPVTGLDRFWISSYNNNGSTGVLVDAAGKERVYRFAPAYSGLYSAAQVDDDTLWFCCTLGSVQKFTLSTGKVEDFQTGGRGLVFSGMPYDPATGKLFVTAFSPPRQMAMTFDIHAKKARLFDAPGNGHYMRFSVSLGDGTYGVSLQLPGNHLTIWDPRTDSLEQIDIEPIADMHNNQATTYMLVQDQRHRVYFPRRGWWNPATRAFDADGPRPRREMTWFERSADRILGVSVDNDVATVGAWDLAGGEVRELCRIPDCLPQQVNATRDGDIVAVNTYGTFYRFDGRSGELICSKPLPIDAVGHADCLARIGSGNGDDRVLGTTYITQRFWEVNLRTGRGADMGRAASGPGEILQVTRIGSMVYMAAYTSGELVAYDPNLPARFPDNPRTVADPFMGMRPVAMCNDGRSVYYSCSLNYGHLGSVLTRYDTRTGLARYASNPLGDQCVVSLHHDRATRTLIAATTIHADCQSAPPTASRCVFARLRDDDFAVLERFDSPLPGDRAQVFGPLGGGAYLAGCRDASNQLIVWPLHRDRFIAPSEDAMRTVPEGTQSILFTGKPGLFVLLIDDELSLWDLRRNKLIRTLRRIDTPAHALRVDGDAMLYTHKRELVVLEHVLANI